MDTRKWLESGNSLGDAARPALATWLGFLFSLGCSRLDPLPPPACPLWRTLTGTSGEALLNNLRLTPSLFGIRFRECQHIAHRRIQARVFRGQSLR